MVAQRLVLLMSAIAMLTGCGLTDDSGKREPAAAAGPAGDWFVDVSEASGLAFRHFNGMTGEFYYPEIMAPGVALLDYDNDGDLDVFAVQGRMLGGGRAATPPAEPLKGRLFRNDVKAPVAPRAFHRRHGRQQDRSDRLRDGCGHRRLRQQRMRRPLRHEPGVEPAAA